MKKVLLQIVSELGVREALLFAGLVSYIYGRYQEAPTRVFVEVGVLFVALGLAPHLAGLVRSLRGGGKG